MPPKPSEPPTTPRPAPPPPSSPPPPPPAGFRSAAATPAVAVDVPEIGLDNPTWQPPRMVLVGVPGFGKTSFFCYAPNPTIWTTPGEDGYDVLLGQRLVPQIPRARLNSWPGTLALAEKMAQSCPYDYIGIDVAGGLDRMCASYVMETQFSGSQKDFDSWGDGTTAMVAEWAKLLAILERVQRQGKGVVFLAHERIKTFNNPEGANYDKFQVVMTPKVWELLCAWSNFVAFGHYETAVIGTTDDTKKGKAKGGKTRVLQCCNSAVYPAKNQYGLDEQIKLLNGNQQLGPHEMWSHVYNLMRGNGQ